MKNKSKKHIKHIKYRFNYRIYGYMTWKVRKCRTDGIRIIFKQDIVKDDTCELSERDTEMLSEVLAEKECQISKEGINMMYNRFLKLMKNMGVDTSKLDVSVTAYPFADWLNAYVNLKIDGAEMRGEKI